MKNIIAKPHLFFFGLTVAFIILGFINRKTTIDINIYATYYVTTIDFWFYLSAIFFALMGLNYFSLFWAEKPPKKSLTIAHISLQIFSLLLLLTKQNWSWIAKKQYPEQLQALYNNSQLIMAISIGIFIFSVFIHLVNFFTNLFLKKI
ncbi:hypothetical protein JL193_00500 [Polaribacter batillariae]|uniref:Cytochrome C and Quinol oxidase polypeptide I n=1 Tax=Polaribacter batillariae TaxID=2808900 RepID=A0ABX7SVB9_9FLAO|nr:hypothetical protein [Polaribacter batillariae]QTD37827.1 hypothetical protein JL193_00500 [Polaribacter batillariae]